MTHREFYEYLNEKYPRTLSAPWDNDGVMLSADMEREVGRVLVALDATEEAISAAAEGGFDMLLTHHPMIFRGVRSVTSESLAGRKILTSVTGGVTVISLHTRLDAGEDGVNESLVRAVGLVPAESFGDDEAPTIGRIAQCEPMTAREFALLLKEKTGAPMVRVTGDLDTMVSRIGFCGGDGKSLVMPALFSGCDGFVTGDAGYNMAEDANEEGLTAFELGHYHSEATVLPKLCELVRDAAGAEAEIYDSCAYTVI